VYKPTHVRGNILRVCDEWIYMSWSTRRRPADPAELDNQVLNVDEVRRVAWPDMRRGVVRPTTVPAGIAGYWNYFSGLRTSRSRRRNYRTPYHRVTCSAKSIGGFKLDDGVYLRTQIPCSFWVDTMVTDQNAASEEIER